MNRNILIGLAILVTGVLAGGTWVLTQPTRTPDVTQFEVGDTPVQVADEDLPEVVEMSLGNPDADVTVIEYASFTCPHCANFHSQVYGELKANYIDTGKINFIYREVYFDKFGLWAGMVARCAGPDRYFGISDLIYDTQSEWLASRNEAGIAQALRKLGLTAGLTEEQLDACLADGSMAQAMVAEYQKNAQADDINSTPSFVINGQKYSNMSYTDFSAILDEKLDQ